MKKIEQIAYDLNMWHEPNDKVTIAIAKVLQKLPQEVYDYAIERIFFEFVPVSGMAIRLSAIRREKKYMVVIKNRDPYVIAHEIAHSHLGHGNRQGANSVRMYDKDEMEAQFLAEKWGFMPKQWSYQIPDKMSFKGIEREAKASLEKN
jgi:Zn-dependent peptidase ImmA (M78 family)